MITLDRSAIGPKLSEFIRGWKSVEPLRRLVAGKGTECDLEDAAAWTRHWYLKMVYSAAYIPELTFETHHLWFKLMQMINPEDTIPIPDGLELLPFQITGARFIIDHDFAIVGDEMGTGKTIQTIAALNAITPGRILIVCTASLKSNWKYELEKWSTRPYKINIVTTRTKSFDGDVVIINYDLLKVRNLGDQHFDTVICDEAHNIANIESAKTKEALQWAEKAKRKIFLTGTPIRKSPYDLFPIISISRHSLSKDFLEKYVRMEQREMPNGYGGSFSYTKYYGKNLPELNEKLNDVMIRRLKKDVLPQLPPKFHQIISIPGGKLDEKTKLRVSQLLDGDDAYRKAVFASGGEVEIDGHISKLRHEEALTKVPHVVKHVEAILEDSESKVVVFFHHEEVGKRLSSNLSNHGVCFISGETKPEVRGEIVKAFSVEGRPNIFIGSIHAAGEGINLTAADTVVFAELDWDFTSLAQAEDRLHRIGQHHPVVVQHFVLEGGIDEMISRSIIGKKQQSKKAVG